VAQHESFETVAAVGFAVDDVEDFFVKLVPLRKAACPVVSSSTAVFR
jgi:hypothetical protein